MAKKKQPEILEDYLDFVETELHNKIKAGDVEAIIFYLKTHGKHRGYVETQEFEIEGK